MTRDLAELAITTLWRILFATPKILPRHADHDIAQRRCWHHEARDRMMKTMNGAEGSRRRYDTSLRRLVHWGGGRDLIRDLRIPRSTVSGWKRKTPPPAVGPGDADSETKMRAENAN